MTGQIVPDQVLIDKLLTRVLTSSDNEALNARSILTNKLTAAGIHPTAVSLCMEEFALRTINRLEARIELLQSSLKRASACVFENIVQNKFKDKDGVLHGEWRSILMKGLAVDDDQITRWELGDDELSEIATAKITRMRVPKPKPVAIQEVAPPLALDVAADVVAPSVPDAVVAAPDDKKAKAKKPVAKRDHDIIVKIVLEAGGVGIRARDIARRTGANTARLNELMRRGIIFARERTDYKQSASNSTYVHKRYAPHFKDAYKANKEHWEWKDQKRA